MITFQYHATIISLYFIQLRIKDILFIKIKLQFSLKFEVLLTAANFCLREQLLLNEHRVKVQTLIIIF